ncbi:thioredoxin-like protein [Plasmodium gaboni]|uniref:Thioredoxin-like protein n=1 Tax=Plasmodium gaboni TaxID=647221 RepID=A0A151LBB0_9APIC|nr:thioredoxin-like protein [Plasmodium gaboni]XP_028540951.1 thioredoxin-like protein [Plasmodium sp. gorilla clade G2]KYN96209.1 thioredoxin-like protein [Plasmodium gaboni]SOV19652.1 thioredoxin-like protein [Plasmodium gaboni]SOV19734.1 thioredoxin-like protein [Plasmodium sp. gorilla clade G2]
MKRTDDKIYVDINNEEEYKNLFDDKNDILYIIDIYTRWCGPCIFTFEMINKIYKNNLFFSENVKLFSICAQTVASLKNYDNNSRPFYIILKNGEIVQQIQGCNIPLIFSFIDEHLMNKKIN